MSVTLKIYEAVGVKKLIPSKISKMTDFIKWFEGYLTKDHLEYDAVVVSDLIEPVKEYLNLKEGVDARDGISGGCYGARDGNVFGGLTVYIDTILLPERWLDEEEDEEVVNIKVLLNEYGTRIDIDAEVLSELLESQGFEYKSDNTYNYENMNSEDLSFLQTVQYEVYKTPSGGAIVIASFHGGGDVRGNYGTPEVYEFKYCEDIYLALMPFGS